MEQMIRGSRVNVSPWERWASVIGGASLLMRAMRRHGGWAAALMGAALVRRGATGHCDVYHALGLSTASRDQGRATVPYRQGIRVDEAVTIDKSPQELYGFWRRLENLPRFMKHLISVTQLDEKRSHWIAKGPGGSRVEWDAEIINDVPGEVIGWRSLRGSDVDNAGSVQFKKLPNGRGTTVAVELQYVPPGGMLTALTAKLFGEEPEVQVREDLRRLKQILEAGEIPVTQSSPAEKTAAEDMRRKPARMEPADLADQAASSF